jgi:hypothetical protein
MTAEQQIAVDIEGAAQMLGMPTSTFYKHVYPAVRSGGIASFKVGRCRLILVESLRAWAARQAQYTSAAEAKQ